MEFKNINELFTSVGKVNSAIIRRDWFRDTEIFKYIMDNSSELNVFGNQVELGHRIWFIKDNMKLGKCPVCQKPYLMMARGHGNHTFSLCDCKKNYTIESRNRLVENRYNSKIELIESINSSTELQLSETEFNRTLNELNSKSANFQFLPSRKYKDFYSDLVVKTKHILPIETFDFSQRLYLINNKLNSIPICEHCHHEMKFINRFNGYNCPCQKLEKSQETRFKSYLKIIPEIINADKYEIIKFPYRLSEGVVIKCKKCGKESIIRVKDGRLNHLNKNSILCKHCEPYNGTSRIEKDISDFIQSLIPILKVVKNDRTVLNGKELDIYIPEIKLAFELDGLYWHQDRGNENDKNRHLTKTNECEKQGIHLIHIFENEWNFKQEIVKSRIKNLLGIYDKVVYARKCEVKEVSSKDSFDFQCQNHIQGGVHCSVNLGLYYDNELVSLMTFSKPRLNKK